MGIAEGLQRGFLSDVDYRLLADNLDWEAIQKQSKNRYSLTQLNDKMIIPTRDEEAPASLPSPSVMRNETAPSSSAEPSITRVTSPRC
jgi:hypothetical protein